MNECLFPCNYGYECAAGPGRACPSVRPGEILRRSRAAAGVCVQQGPVNFRPRKAYLTSFWRSVVPPLLHAPTLWGVLEEEAEGVEPDEAAEPDAWRAAS